MKRVVVLVAALCWGLAASAMSLREWRSLQLVDEEHGPAYAEYYLIGALEGILEAHDQAVRAGAKPFICRNGRRLEPQMAQSLFSTELQRNADQYEADMPVTLVLSNALSTVYTCS